ncbi:sodium:glutamate symporter [candidate division KSB1 bacterium]|nr:sodium:glutamate symporter [candidate division KSB1 bacterium]RQV99753.1 MAG: sodium:glutamate symporter [candidate division KSB1 bacterium]
MNFSWHIFVNLGILSAALLLGTFLRARVAFFQKYLIPNALTAGFIVLPLYNFVFPEIGLSAIQLGEITYHFLGLSFIALGLRTPPKGEKRGPAVFQTSIGIISQIVLQAIIGFGLTIFFIKTFMPNLFHTFGFLLPLGFAEGPGQAFSIGEAWKVHGVQDAGNIGLTFAAIGFILCCFGGIFLINHALRKGWISQQELKHMRKKETQTGIRPRNSKLLVGAYQTTDTEAIDSVSLHMALVLMSYFGAWLMLKGITFLLDMLGPIGHELAANLWGLHFIFAVTMGLLVRQFIKAFKCDHVVDNRTMTRISGLSVDIMVTSAIAAISIIAVAKYWVPLVIIAGIGAVATFFGTIWFCSRLFSDHRFLRTLFIFGVSTGTLSTGLALLRAVDPEFESPVAVDYTYASGVGFLMTIPLILIIPMPLRTFTTGNWIYSWIAFAIIGVYLLFVLVSYALISKRKALGQKERLWFKTQDLATKELKA